MLCVYYAALGQLAELSIELVFAAGPVAAIHQELRRAVERLRASVEAMPSGSQHTREAKDAFMAMLAVIEQRLGTSFAPGPDEQRSDTSGTHGDNDGN